jgi:hypothetical protein
MSSICHSNQPLNFKMMENKEKNELIAYLQALPNRDGDRPLTTGPVPHTQQNQFPDAENFADNLHQYTMTFQGVSNGPSYISNCGSKAYFVNKNNTETSPLQFLIGNEFAHIHSHGSKSLHLALPTDLGHALEQKGWTENHPLAVANRIPETNYMLFGARNEEELAVSKVLLRVSYLFATNQWD